MTLPTRLLLAVALVLGTGGLAAGCGTENDESSTRRTVADASSSSADPTSPAATTNGAAEAPAAAYTAWIDALSRQDAAAACALQAPEFTIELRYEAILVERAELGDPCTGFEALLWEDPGFDSEIVDIEVTQVTNEDAILDVRGGDGPQTVTMTYHRAKWRVLRTAERGDADGTAGRWLAAWCRLDPSMTRAEIIELMGEPSGEYTVSDGGEPQLWWAKDQYDFRVYLDVDGSVLELVGDYDALSADDRALLPCPELRN
jgi:hypothetical protein